MLDGRDGKGRGGKGGKRGGKRGGKGRRSWVVEVGWYVRITNRIA